MATATRLHEGRWRTLPNLAANLKGSIHDDERARELGFRGGFVPGPTVAEALLPAGGPLAPPPALFRAGGQVRTEMPPGDDVMPPGINADFQIVIERPVLVGQPYVVSGALVDMGVSGRTHFWTTEFAIADQAGVACATGRQKVKSFAKRNS